LRPLSGLVQMISKVIVLNISMVSSMKCVAMRGSFFLKHRDRMVVQFLNQVPGAVVENTVY
jgi:hypothetical protein